MYVIGHSLCYPMGYVQPSTVHALAYSVPASDPPPTLGRPRQPSRHGSHLVDAPLKQKSLLLEASCHIWYTLACRNGHCAQNVVYTHARKDIIIRLVVSGRTACSARRAGIGSVMMFNHTNTGLPRSVIRLARTCTGGMLS